MAAAAGQSVEKEIKKIVSDKAKDRPPTPLGARHQGDHVSAYALFKECFLNKCLTGALSFQESIELLISIITKYAPEQDDAKIFSDYRARIAESPDFVTPEEEKEIKEALNAIKEQKLREKSIALIQRSNESILRMFLNDLIESHYTLRNKLEFTSFPKEGNVEPPAGEGGRVRKAVSDLREAAEHSPLDVESIADKMKVVFWFPEIPPEELLDEKSKKWEEIRKKKYKKETKPRNNDPEILCQVIQNHLSLIFICYPKFHEQQDLIVTEFIKRVINDWPDLSKDRNKCKAVNETVLVNLDAIHGFWEEDPSRGALKSKRESSILPSTPTPFSPSKTPQEPGSLSEEDDPTFSYLEEATPRKQRKKEDDELKRVEAALKTKRGDHPVTYKEKYEKIINFSKKREKSVSSSSSSSSSSLSSSSSSSSYSFHPGGRVV